MSNERPQTIEVIAPFSLSQTSAPVYWSTSRSSRHAWDNGKLIWVGWADDRVVWRRVEQLGSTSLLITGDRDPESDRSWARLILDIETHLPKFDDPVIAALADRFPGLHAYCDGSVYEGLITAIVGQSISVASAAVTQARLSSQYSPAVNIDGVDYRPLPRAEHLAESTPSFVRESGVTMKRAEALVHIAREALSGNLPSDAFARSDPEAAAKELLRLPLVGRWTAESVMLWGVGASNAHPTGDVALLRAARHAYDSDEITLRSLDVLAEQWQPARAMAARLLWANLFGTAPDSTIASHPS